MDSFVENEQFRYKPKADIEEWVRVCSGSGQGLRVCRNTEEWNGQLWSIYDG